MGIEKLTSDEIADSWQGQFLFKKKPVPVKAYAHLKSVHCMLYWHMLKMVMKVQSL